MRFLTVIFGSMVLGLGTSADAAKYSFGTEGSVVTFHNVASLHSFDGDVEEYSGDFDSSTGTGLFVVKTKSMTTNLGPRDKRMHAYCLESDKFPTIQFSVSGVDGLETMNSEAKRGKVTLKGNLTIRDVTKTISVPTAFVKMGNDMSLQGQFDFKWTDYEVPDPSIFISTLYPDMSMKFSLRLKGEAAPAPPAAAPAAEPTSAEPAPEGAASE